MTTDIDQYQARFCCDVTGPSRHLLGEQTTGVLDSSPVRRHECLTHAPGHEIPASKNASYDWLAIRRVAGLLAGRMDQGSAFLPRDAGPHH